MQRLLIVVACFLAASCSSPVIKASSGDPQPVGAFGGGGAAGTVSRATPLEELTMVYMVRQRSDLHVKIAEVVSDAIVD